MNEEEFDNLKPSDVVRIKNVSFKEKNGSGERFSQSRRFLIVDKQNDEVILKSITSRVAHRTAVLYGKRVKNLEVAGLVKESAILCTEDNELHLTKNDIKYIDKKVGTLDKKEFLEVKRKSLEMNRRNIQLKYKITIRDNEM